MQTPPTSLNRPATLGAVADTQALKGARAAQADQADDATGHDGQTLKGFADHFSSRSLLPGIPVLHAHLPARGTRAGKVAETLATSAVIAGGAIGALVAGPLGAAVGLIAGVVGGVAGATFLLQPGWVESKVEKVREAVLPEGTDLKDTAGLATPLSEPAFQSRIDRETGTSATTGNQIRLLATGPESFEARFRLMEQATSSIQLQTYIFHDDETGKRVADLLSRKAREGVDVRVLVDAVGSGDTPAAFFDEMRAAGVKVCEFSPLLGNLARANQRWHQKILTVDGAAAVVGGMNIGSEYALGGSRRVDLSKGAESPSAMWMNDMDVAQSGPGVADITRAFAQNWQAATEETVPGPPRPEAKVPLAPPGASLWGLHRPSAEHGDVRTRFLTHRPVEDKDSRIEDWYVSMLDTCAHTAYLTNAYFVPTPRLQEALERAARRGVDVRLLTNSPETTDSLPAPQLAGRSSYEDLLAAGVRIYEAQDQGKVLRHLHKKVAVFDGYASTVGSANLDPRSADLNSEDTLCIDDARVGRDLTEVFARDLKRSREIDMKILHGGTMLERAEQWLYGDVVRQVL